MVIGLGTELRGDDAVGLEVARALRARSPALNVQEHHGEPLGLIALWEGADRVVVIDAVYSGAQPGTLHRLDAAAGPMPHTPRRLTSHKLGLADAIELGRSLRRLPPSLTVLGIEGSCFELGAPLSDQVREAARLLAEELVARA